jgi:hypothetical protein
LLIGVSRGPDWVQISKLLFPRWLQAFALRFYKSFLLTRLGVEGAASCIGQGLFGRGSTPPGSSCLFVVCFFCRFMVQISVQACLLSVMCCLCHCYVTSYSLLCVCELCCCYVISYWFDFWLWAMVLCDFLLTAFVSSVGCCNLDSRCSEGKKNRQLCCLGSQAVATMHSFLECSSHHATSSNAVHIAT